MKSAIPGASAGVMAGRPEILKIRPAQSPSWGWGLGLSLAKILRLHEKCDSKKTGKEKTKLSIKITH